MKFKHIYILIYSIVLLNGCATGTYQSSKISEDSIQQSGKGFVLIYDESLNEEKIIRKKIKNDHLVVIHNTIKKNSYVDIFNPKNSKSLKAKVVANDDYPPIYKIIVSKKIAQTLELDINNPYVEFFVIRKNKTFVAKEAEIFQEEKEVAEKVSVNEVKIDDISISQQQEEAISLKKSFYILISDFYYLENAKNLKKQLSNKLKSNKLAINSINNNKHRLYVGPFKNFKSLQSTYIKLNKEGFTDLDIYQK